MAFSTGKTPDQRQPDRQQVSPEGRRRRRTALVVLFLLMMLLSFLLGRATYQPSAPPVVFETPTLPAAPTPAPAPKTVASAPVVTTPPPATTPPAPAASVMAAAPTTEAPPVTAILEVTVGTHSNGGLTLKFDHPVSWTVSNNTGKGDAEVDIQGVHDLDTFPRNLPLPPGVMVIHAGIVDADTLHLRFTLRPNLLAFTAPAVGPSPVLSLFFRTAAQAKTVPALPLGIQTTGGCGNGASAMNGKAIALLQRSLDRNAAYADVRTALTLLETCTGDGSKAEQLLAQDLKAGGGDAMRVVVADAALRFARGDAGGALQLLKANLAATDGDRGYAELIADLQAAIR